MIEKSELGKLLTPRRDINTPIYNWYPYKHSYSKDLVLNLLEHFGLTSGSWVLDPFCGGGNTLLTCKNAGINSQGYDILPFAVFLTRAKTSNYNAETVQAALELLIESKHAFAEGYEPSTIPIYGRAFGENTQRWLHHIKSRIDKIMDLDTRNLATLAVLSILESVAKVAKSGGFLRIIERSEASCEELERKFIDRFRSFLDNVKTNTLPEPPLSFAELGDARKLPLARQYDAVITSPPYPNRHDYTRIYSLELAYHFLADNDQLKRLRYRTLRSHVEAREQYFPDEYNEPFQLTTLLNQALANGFNNPQVYTMMRGYFADMFMVLKEIKKSLKSNGRVAVVVSNVRFAGTMIPVDELLLEIGQQAGLKPVDLWVARYRGNSSQQMKTYGRMPTRESIVQWETND
ncbi:MAG: hypothetical protein ACRKGH_03700 [Dehalogenimonas sp.]